MQAQFIQCFHQEGGVFAFEHGYVLGWPYEYPFGTAGRRQRLLQRGFVFALDDSYVQVKLHDAASSTTRR